MDLLIFDMDGVLLEANGYHKALQKTVQLAASHLSIDNIQLSQEQIDTFESLGISSEWHSGALCMAFLEIQLLAGVTSPKLDLSQLFAAIQDQPLTLPARQRGRLALKEVSLHFNVDNKKILHRIDDSEQIERSLTMNWFQELVLGSEAYQDRYRKKAQINTPSYLEIYDQQLISAANVDLIASRTTKGGLGSVIMTNRPSAGPGDFNGSPEAELGRELVGFADIPLIGYGEISWLAALSQTDPDQLAKPNPCHALAAIFIALGFPKEISLTASLGDFSKLDPILLEKLMGKSITVFEDTPAGIRSVKQAGSILQQARIEVEIVSIGIANSSIKKTTLKKEGARVVNEINTALSGLDHLRSFS
jgi:hypothetical protein